jgi:uncharacterized protein
MTVPLRAPPAPGATTTPRRASASWYGNPTQLSAGEAKVTTHCEFCDDSIVVHEVIPRLPPPSSGSSSGRGSSGGSSSGSFGGGRSGGGGAGGSY